MQHLHLQPYVFKRESTEESDIEGEPGYFTRNFVLETKTAALLSSDFTLVFGCSNSPFF